MENEENNSNLNQLNDIGEEMFYEVVLKQEKRRKLLNRALDYWMGAQLVFGTWATFILKIILYANEKILYNSFLDKMAIFYIPFVIVSFICYKTLIGRKISYYIAGVPILYLLILYTLYKMICIS